MAPLVGSENSTTGGPSRAPPGLHRIVRPSVCALPRNTTVSAHRDLPELIPGPLVVLAIIPPDTEVYVVRATTTTCTRVLVCPQPTTMSTHLNDGLYVRLAHRYCEYRMNTQEMCWDVICCVGHKRAIDLRTRYHLTIHPWQRASRLHIDMAVVCDPIPRYDGILCVDNVECNAVARL
jgi:hypothetical protein